MKGDVPVTWQGVRDEVRRRINARDYAPGDTIPKEVDLAREFGCARATMNRALRDLAEAGLLQRRRKGGTLVAQNPVRRAVLRIPVIREEIEAAGMEAGYRLLDCVEAVPPVWVAKVFALAPALTAYRVSALHLANDMPYVLEERWINSQVAVGVEQADFAQISANEWLIRNAPFHDGDITFTATSADARLAGLLDCKLGAALMVLERETRSERRVITIARLTYRPGHRIESSL